MIFQLPIKTEEDHQMFDDTDAVTEESSPNSISKYSNSVPEKSNILICNKGKVKDEQEFKKELVELLTEKRTCAPKPMMSKNT